MALTYLRWHYAHSPTNAVVYFADDDNAYDLRLFDRYIRNVQTIGFWAVGLAGAAKVEAPRVENRTIVKWDVYYMPSRKFGTDMSGFAVNLDLIVRSTATFHEGCVMLTPENCFLGQFGIPKEQTEAFGYDDDPKEILVWHTRTGKTKFKKTETYGYIAELPSDEF
ncbi:glycosyltransferase family 43 protein [Aphelenchoides avenae]|nr:glycosyltransferase family 43 protein [Aphelenchus avenae]